MESRKPKIRFKGFTDPWEQRKFSEIAHRSSNASSDPTLLNVEYDDIVSSQGILNKDLNDKAGRKSGLLFEPGDVLYGKLRPYLQNWLLPAFTGIAVGDWWVLKPDEVTSNYLYTMVKSEAFSAVANVSAGSKMPRADWSLVSETEFSIPASSNEQEAIGSFFSQLDHLITLHQRKLNALKNVKKSLLEKMFPKPGEFVPEIRFEGFTDPWEQRKFSEIAHRSSNASSDPTLLNVEYDDIVSSQGILNKDLNDKAGRKSGLLFEPGDVLYGKLRPYLQNWLLPAFTGIAVGDWWVLKPDEVTSNYLYTMVKSEAFSAVANVSAGSKMPRADWSLVSETEFSIPASSNEQEAIGSFFSQLDHLITLHQRKLNALKNVKKSLLEKMFV
ncbi:restriction endonuclease subunit S [Pauljensenia sp. UMB1235]|uniref:restriction endonuclease subunit S n=1 Tax=unclassified Pauljensenia TaxID=2908895 RepID=UPI00254A2A22|nr:MULTISPECIES: restriction endonuclease subunit S [unclassified Pauljensenia]MDK6400618.1 restriction endonuclease subunit S [Pauljensenia sp. UMB9872]MDK7173050.1 restriction endonuclease subunit S [Pauljensenia sp. UMB1235]